MKFIKSAFFLFAALSFTACKEDLNSNIKTEATGRAGEIMVVLDDNKWKGEIGDSIFNTLSAPFEILPQDESVFKVMHVNPNAFKTLLRKHRNILVVYIDKENSKTELKEINDQWALNQLVIQISAPSDSAFIDFWNNHKTFIVNKFFNRDIQRLQLSYENYVNKDAINQIKKLYNVNILIPSDYKLDVKKPHFAWISKETQSTGQGIFIYDYPYENDKQLTPEQLVIKRDAITKENVPGPKDGTYMQTEKRIPVNVENIEINGQKAVLIRGLWYIENYLMGGPFLSITFHDKTRNRIVTIDAYVYAGKLDKKIYMWQIEAIIKTANIIQ